MKHQKSHPLGEKRQLASQSAISEIINSSWGKSWMFCLFLVMATLLAYQPVWHAGFIWDDEQYVNGNATLHSLDGLRQIWLLPSATVQYYPLTFTTFWLEYHLWGLYPLGYHLVNVLLHSFNAILFWIILRRLRVPGAWLGAAIFALHPVCAESVAWVTERKNTLSGLFYLGSLLTALRFWLPEEASANPIARFGGWKFYWLALALYLCALWSKTAAAPLPAVVLLLIWWKHRRIEWPDAFRILPFFVTGAVLGFVTIHGEKQFGTAGKSWDLSFVERCLIAGKDIWFYLGKLLWPHPLIYVYPHWHINPSDPYSYLPILLVIAGLSFLWWKREKWGRPILVGVVYFIVLLLPVLGFFNIFYFRESYVSDHFQYLAMLGPLALLAAGIDTAFQLFKKRDQFLELLFSGILLLTLGVLTWRHAGVAVNNETLWRDTLAKNPDSGTMQNNLGCFLKQEGRMDEALIHLRKAAEIYPEDARVQDNLGSALVQKGEMDAAYGYFQRALILQPDYVMTYNNLGDFFLRRGQTDRAIAFLQKALAMQSDLVEANYNLGNAFLQDGDTGAAIQQWQKTLIVQPDYVPALNNLGNFYLNQGNIESAIVYFQKAVAIQPDFAEADNNLGSALIQSGQIVEAIGYLKRALAIQPDYVSAQNNLAWVLATCSQGDVRNGKEALKLAHRANELSGGNNPLILRTLAAALAENGQFVNAVTVAQSASQLAQSNPALAANIQAQIERYEIGLPIRE